jgi:hypothetical protein
LKYNCNILKKDCQKSDADDKTLPNDAKLVTYLDDGRVCYDITRAPKMVDVFDFYYDTYGPGNLLSITWTNGRVNPKLMQTPKPNEKK